MGAPTCAVHTSASSGNRRCSTAEAFNSIAPRSCADNRGHGPVSNAARAAAIARSISSGVPSGNVMITSSVTGEITESRSFPRGVVHLPSTKTHSGAWIESVGWAIESLLYEIFYLRFRTLTQSSFVDRSQRRDFYFLFFFVTFFVVTFFVVTNFHAIPSRSCNASGR